MNDKYAKQGGKSCPMCWALLLQWQSHFAPQNKEDFMLDKMIGFIGAGNM